MASAVGEGKGNAAGGTPTEPPGPPVDTPATTMMPVKVLYTFDERHEVTFLARSTTATGVQTVKVGGNGGTESIGFVSLRFCLLSVARSSPELVHPAQHDWSVYSLDCSEVEEPYVGQGFLTRLCSAPSSTAGSDTTPEPPRLISGRIRADALGQSALEVRLRLSAIPGTCQEASDPYLHSVIFQGAGVRRSSSNQSVSPAASSIPGRGTTATTTTTTATGRRPGQRGRPRNSTKNQQQSATARANLPASAMPIPKPAAAARGRSIVAAAGLGLPEPSPSSPKAPDMGSSPPALPTDCATDMEPMMLDDGLSYRGGSEGAGPRQHDRSLNGKENSHFKTATTATPETEAMSSESAFETSPESAAGHTDAESCRGSVVPESRHGDMESERAGLDEDRQSNVPLREKAGGKENSPPCVKEAEDGSGVVQLPPRAEAARLLRSPQRQARSSFGSCRGNEVASLTCPNSKSPSAHTLQKPSRISNRERVEEMLMTSLKEGRIPQYCANCGAIKTNCWRQIQENPSTPSLTVCNACGVYWRQHKQMRPQKYWSCDIEPKVVKKRKTISPTEDSATSVAAAAAAAAAAATVNSSATAVKSDMGCETSAIVNGGFHMRRCLSSPPDAGRVKSRTTGKHVAAPPSASSLSRSISLSVDASQHDDTPRDSIPFTEQVLSEPDPIFDMKEAAVLTTPKRARTGGIAAGRQQLSGVASPSPWRHGIFDATSGMDFAMLTPRRQLKQLLEQLTGPSGDHHSAGIISPGPAAALPSSSPPQLLMPGHTVSDASMWEPTSAVTPTRSTTTTSRQHGASSGKYRNATPPSISRFLVHGSPTRSTGSGSRRSSPRNGSTIALDDHGDLFGDYMVALDDSA